MASENSYWYAKELEEHTKAMDLNASQFISSTENLPSRKRKIDSEELDEESVTEEDLEGLLNDLWPLLQPKIQWMVQNEIAKQSKPTHEISPSRFVPSPHATGKRFL